MYSRTIHGSWMRIQSFLWTRFEPSLLVNEKTFRRTSGEVTREVAMFQPGPNPKLPGESSFTLIVSIGGTIRDMLNPNDDRPCRLIRLEHIRVQQSSQAHRIRMQWKDSNKSRRWPFQSWIFRINTTGPVLCITSVPRGKCCFSFPA